MGVPGKNTRRRVSCGATKQCSSSQRLAIRALPVRAEIEFKHGALEGGLTDATRRQESERLFQHLERIIQVLEKLLQLLKGVEGKAREFGHCSWC